MEEYINDLAGFHKPKSTLDHYDDATAAECYYDPYSRLLVHEQILSDYETIETYKAWINSKKDLIKGKIVLDVGCGTGILSMLAAEAGAARVIGIEWSNIADYTEEIIKENYMDDRVFIIKGKVGRAILPYNIRKVDVIISMWMGFSLIQGDRLNAVIQARDKWLAPMGVIIPDRAILYMSAISDHNFREDDIESWKNVYGYNMSCVIDEALKHAYCRVVPPNNMVTNRCKIKEINLLTDSLKNIFKNVNFRLTALRNDHIQAFITHFTVKFSKCDNGLEINTDPLFAPKRWGQTVMYMKDYITIRKKEKIVGTVSFFQVNKDHRLLGIFIGMFFRGAITGEVKKTHSYIINV
ncbi:protein arginine N-methyltransferase 1-like isoform X2 [Planococcus citri]|uniref:protein arginine N-methyltransferase 1-like isoform X2 n=1 Tax=Planococcus citri TaxID=170843 RepID=UPI0031F8CB2C